MLRAYLDGETIFLEADKELARLLLRAIFEENSDFNYREMGKLTAFSWQLEKFLDILGEVSPEHPEYDLNKRISITDEEIAERDSQILRKQNESQHLTE
jgi:hypothetical protein